MAISLPFIPESITVHLGAPDSPAENVTLAFSEYIKNVASSEIYPTWEDSALRANILAIVTFALNRIFTGFYVSRGYPFDITSSTAFDQKFIRGRNIFDNVSRLTDNLFDDYIRRSGFIDPIAAKFCNGTTVTCQGLSQWGSQSLAQSGYNYVEILKYYYGDDIELVINAPIMGFRPTYPGYPLRIGDSGSDVTTMQVSLNRIAQNYPLIPKIYPVDGIFGSKTEASILEFQRIFNLSPDGIVGKATWYEIQRLFVGVKRLSELNSEGLRYSDFSWEYPDAIKLGDSGIKVNHLQYMLSVTAEFYNEIPPLDITGNFDERTNEAVLSFQRLAGIKVDGIVGANTWDTLYSYFISIESIVFKDASLFPFRTGVSPAENAADLQEQLSILNNFSDYTQNRRGIQNIRRSISQFQTKYKLPVTGHATLQTRANLAKAADDIRYARTTRMMQHPGFDMSLGDKDKREVVQ